MSGPLLFLLVALIALAGSFVQSTTGFGYAVTCMALWPLLLPFKTATVVELITATFMTVTIAVRYWKFINWRQLVWPCVVAVCTNWVGVQILQSSTETFLRRVLGAALMVLAVYFLFFSERLRIRPTRSNGMIAGAVAGLSGGMFSIGGPPIVAYYLNALEDKREYTATTQMFFIITTMALLVMHIRLGNVTREVLRFSAAAVAGLAVGTGLGLAVFRRLPLTTIKRLVYGFMLGMGLYILIFAKRRHTRPPGRFPGRPSVLENAGYEAFSYCARRAAPFIIRVGNIALLAMERRGFYYEPDFEHGPGRALRGPGGDGGRGAPRTGLLRGTGRAYPGRPGLGRCGLAELPRGGL